MDVLSLQYILLILECIYYLKLNKMFISVKEAVELTGKSQTTIYRLCKKRIRTDFVKVENSQYFIDKDYLLETYPPGNEEDELIDIEEEENSPINEDTSINNKPEFEIEDKTQDVDILANQISERIEKEENNSIQEEKAINDNFNFDKLSYWESIIGLSVSGLLIIGFILMLYFNSK